MKVNFMIIGTQKCGIGTLFRMLSNHPKLVRSKPKEPQYFSKVKSTTLDLDYYHSLFEKKEGALYYEGSTTYTFYPSYHLKIWDIIYEYNPSMKFIYIVRHPVDRIISAYMHAYLRGEIEMDIESAVIHNRFFIDITRYYTQISPYVNKFGRDNVLLLDFDNLTNHPKKTISKVSAFLGIDPELFDENVYGTHANKSVGRKIIHKKLKSPLVPIRVIQKLLPPLWKKIEERNSRKLTKRPNLSGDLKNMIHNMLELEINEMEKLMGKDLSKWKKPHTAAEPAASNIEILSP